MPKGNITSIDRDGMKDSYDLELTRAVMKMCRFRFITSGGAGASIYEGAVIGKADGL